MMAQEVFASLGKTADQKLHELADSSREQFETIKNKSLGELYRDGKGWVQHNPGKSLVGAAATGFLLGWLVRRR